MRRLHGDYALSFNRRHGRCGHLFQGRYGATRVRDDVHLLTVLRYVVDNPVVAGLCERPGHWQWGSAYAALSGCVPTWLAHERLLGYLRGISGGVGSAAFAELTRAEATTA
jgi:hypothetical protein